MIYPFLTLTFLILPTLLCRAASSTAKGYLPTNDYHLLLPSSPSLDPSTLKSFSPTDWIESTPSQITCFTSQEIHLMQRADTDSGVGDGVIQQRVDSKWITKDGKESDKKNWDVESSGNEEDSVYWYDIIPGDAPEEGAHFDITYHATIGKIEKLFVELDLPHC